MEGRIKRIMDRGYLFLEDVEGKSYFVHRSELKGVEFEDLKEGDLMSFEPGENEKGLNGTNVKRLPEEEKQEDEEKEGGTEEEETE